MTKISSQGSDADQQPDGAARLPPGAACTMLIKIGWLDIGIRLD